MIDPNEVEATLARCLAKDAPDPIIVKGIIHNYALDKNKLEPERERVVGWIKQLPDEFLVSKGGGWSFLNLCMCKDGQWTGFHLQQERLIALAQGLGLASYMFPRELWKMLPGGVPYVQFSTGASDD